MNFSQLKLVRPLLRAVEEVGYERPSPIQAKAIPPVLEGHDLLGCAQTGTGKTAAFALPILQKMAASHPSHKGVRALILTPTRELALQIDDCFAKYSKYLNVRHCVVFGGVGQQPQVDTLRRGTDILTACPGRLNDLIGQGHVNLSQLEVFVLDEADRMLDMGFVNDVKKVIRHLPSQRQNLLFSATMPKEIEQLAGSILRNPVTVKVNPVSSTVERIEQKLYFVEKPQKKHLLAQLLQNPEISSALVFSRTKHGANAIAAFLTKKGIASAAIHGNKSQSARVAALEAFKTGKVRALIATDIAARGIDISELPYVFNFDLPEVPETYVHRIGRTGRAGAEGVAISFCSTQEREYLAGIEKLNRKKIPVVEWQAGMTEQAAETAEQKQAVQPRKQADKKMEQPAKQPRQAKAKKEQIKDNRRQKEQKQPLEESTVEEKTTSSAPLTASAKRRRRRRRAQNKNQAEQTVQAVASVQQSQGEKPARGEKAPRGEKPSRSEKANRPEKAAKPERASRNGGRETTERETAHTPKPHRTERKAQPQVQSDDPGLLLITRRPPAQKFASFEEYMKSREGKQD
ncbi:MAG: DEAD/DEAH box helicase [Candidatus Fournierella pullistercoris]|uniref:ATP-dependent RNA helicase CshA n=1 Tax=Candidatus Allofournierella pullistercoris TaxID=2838597 RepID=A0A948T1Y6_9FIRM|nr:DEAD/DEAH box helicase [Candidatus Fournierella pullistercoris]